MATSAINGLTKSLESGTSSVLPAIYKGESPPLSQIRQYMGEYTGGCVELCCADDGIATITLSQPKKKNALSGKMMNDLYDAVKKLESWKEGKGVILCGAEGNFCSGGDLAMARGTGCADGGYAMATLMNNILNRFQVLPFVTVALINGCGALGGGSELSLACDYRVMSPSCQGLGFVHGRMAIVPAWGGTGRLVKLLGYRKAVDIITSAQVYPPEQALAIGLVDEIAPTTQDPMTYVKDWLAQRTALSSSLVHAIKTTALIADNATKDAQQLEQRIFAPFWGCPENKAALAANIKHKPR